MKESSFIDKIVHFLNYISLIALMTSYLSPYIKPTIFWQVSFIGLIFPLLYTINISFLIYWLVKKRKNLILINIIILIMGSNHVSNYINISKKKKSSIEKVKVLTYNVRLFNKYKWIEDPEIKGKILNFLKEQNADIICIQEFHATNSIPNINYPYKHIGIQNKKSRWHMAIYSKYHQAKKETVSIRGELMNNTCIYSDIILPKDTVRVYNIHLASNWLNESDYAFINKPNQESISKGISTIIQKMKKGYKRRAEEADAIRRHMDSCPHPIIICGDFNDTPLSYAYQTIKGSLTDVFRSSGKGLGTSFVSLPGLRIDYILHDPKFKSINYKKHNQVLSDHHPISCDIIIP